MGVLIGIGPILTIRFVLVVLYESTRMHLIRIPVDKTKTWVRHPVSNIIHLCKTYYDRDRRRRKIFRNPGRVKVPSMYLEGLYWTRIEDWRRRDRRRYLKAPLYELNQSNSRFLSSPSVSDGDAFDTRDNWTDRCGYTADTIKGCLCSSSARPNGNESKGS